MESSSSTWQLVEGGTLAYHSPTGRARRTFRLWESTAVPGHHVAVVVENAADPGMSIVNAAREVRATLEALYGDDLRIFEWWYPGTPNAHLDEQFVTDGVVSWQPAPATPQAIAKAGLPDLTGWNPHQQKIPEQRSADQ